MFQYNGILIPNIIIDVSATNNIAFGLYCWPIKPKLRNSYGKNSVSIEQRITKQFKSFHVHSTYFNKIKINLAFPMSPPIINQSPFTFIVHKKLYNYFFLSPFSLNKLF